jgi:UV radiation resistance-associated gene protein
MCLLKQLQTTCSYSTILKLVTLEDVLRDTTHSRTEIKQNLARLLTQPTPRTLATTLSESRQHLHATHSALQSQKRALTTAKKRVSTLRQSIASRNETMHRSLQSQASSQNTLLEQKHILEERKASLAQLQVALAAQRRRICLDLQAIYPIVSVDDETLRFTIRGIFLAAAGKWDGRGEEEEVATALGWTAHLVWLLSLYLGVPLRYPVQPVGGRSLIKDPVSIMMGSRTYNHS